MFDLIAANPLFFLLALGIGFATGWWVWAPEGARDEEGYDDLEASSRKGAEPRTFTPPDDDESDEIAPVAVNSAPDIAPAVGESEDMTLINGIGPKLAALLGDLGVRRFDQIAAWGDHEVDEVDAHLGSFRGRITRDQWIEQAKLIAKGDMQTWKGRFGYKSK